MIAKVKPARSLNNHFCQEIIKKKIPGNINTYGLAKFPKYLQQTLETNYRAL